MLDGYLTDFSYPWQRYYYAALLELELKKLIQQVTVAEAAIVTRLMTISKSSEHQTERQALEDALSGLHVLRSEADSQLC